MLSRSTRVLHRAARRLPRRNLSTLADSSESVQEQFDPANPTAEHRALRKMVQEFTKNEVEPQALQYNREERLNRALFERAGELGLLGVTVDPEYGGAGMDATAACIVHEVTPVGPQRRGPSPEPGCARDTGAQLLRSGLLPVVLGALPAVCEQPGSEWNSGAGRLLLAG